MVKRSEAKTTKNNEKRKEKREKKRQTEKDDTYLDKVNLSSMFPNGFSRLVYHTITAIRLIFRIHYLKDDNYFR